MREQVDSSAASAAVVASGQQTSGKVPHPGSKQMPPWGSGNLSESPRFTWRQWPLLLGPGLVMGAAAIGGGEWLAGPLNTAR
jgi:hypothetical protein